MPQTGWYEPKTQIGLASFSFNQLQTTAMKYRYVINVNSLRDPIGQKDLRDSCADGRDPKVLAWIKSDLRIPAILQAVEMIGEGDIKADHESFIGIAFADFHGKWISTAVVELVAARLIEKGFNVAIDHHRVG